MISCVTFEYSKNPGCPVAFFPKLAALRKKFFPGGLNRFSVASRICRRSAKNFLARCLLHVAGQFRSETGGGSSILDPELWINVFKMFADGRGADPENRADLGIGFPARASQASASRSRGLMTCNSRGAQSS